MVFSQKKENRISNQAKILLIKVKIRIIYLCARRCAYLGEGILVFWKSLGIY